MAWDFTRAKLHCGRELHYPTEHMRWGLAGTANTMTFLHINCDGFNTFLKVVCGMKVWGFYQERPENPLSLIDIFLNEGFHLDEIPNSAAYNL